MILSARAASGLYKATTPLIRTNPGMREMWNSERARHFVPLSLSLSFNGLHSTVLHYT